MVEPKQMVQVDSTETNSPWAPIPVDIEGGGAGGGITEGEVNALIVSAVPLTAPHPAGQSVSAALKSRSRSVTMGACGDSTTTGSNGWFSLLGLALAGTTHTVLHRAWDQSAESWGRLVNLNTPMSGPERGVRLNGQTITYPNPSDLTGVSVLDVSARVTPDSWASGAAQTILSKWNTGDSRRSWSFGLSSAGMLSLSLSPDGSTSLSPSATSTVAVPFANGVGGWVRAVLQGDNGSGSRVVTFYTSENGDTWTQLGSVRTNTGTATLFKSDQPIAFGAQSVNGTWFNKLVGVLHFAEVRTSAGGANLVPILPDPWDVASNDPSVIVWEGAPVLLLLNSGAASQNIAYHSASIRSGSLLGPTRDLALLFVNEGHNNSDFTGSAWKPHYAAFLMTLRDIVGATVPILALDQNPVRASAVATGTQSGFSPGAYAMREQRAVGTLAVAATAGAGIYPLSVRPAFTDGPDYAATIRDDGLHPTTAADTPGGGSGHEVQARYLARLLG